MDKKELTNRVSQRTGQNEQLVAEVVDATFEEIYEAIKREESVSIRHFGTFYVRAERSSWVFKFSPSQRLRKLLGWSSTYKGKL